MMVWLGVILVIFFGTAGYYKVKFNKFYVPHTLIDKVVGGATYFMPFAVRLVRPVSRMWVEAILLTLAALETLAIQIKSKMAQDFVLSVFSLKK